MIVSSDAPLAVDQGVSAVFATLGACFHLERLVAEDAARIEQASDLVRSWFGSELKWSWLTFADGIAPFRPSDFEYACCYCEDLEVPEQSDPSLQVTANNLVKLGREDYGVAFKGGETNLDASPWSFAFWAEIPEVDERNVLSPFGTLALTVPTTIPLGDLAREVDKLAGILRYRWATCGLTYSTWNVQDWEVATDKIFAHARRFPGFDVGYYHRNLEAFFDRIRTVSWLTYVGPDLTDVLRRSGASLASSTLVQVGSAGGGVVLRAGAHPEPGDVNRLRYPRAYIEADAMIRAVRASDPSGVVFLGPWQDSDVADWLRRFEKRVA